MSYQTGVLEALRDHGLNIGIVPGWEGRGSSLFVPRGHVCHHDADPSRWADPPGIFVSGRPDLAGPLCNTALSAYGKVWLVAAGRANHAGLGGWHGLTGNSSVWGTEAQNAGTGQTWPDEQMGAYVQLSAALGQYFGFSADMVCRHAEWAPTRKIDPWGPWADGHHWEHDANYYRSLVAEGGDDMFSDQDRQNLIKTTQELEGVGNLKPSLEKRIEAAVEAQAQKDRRAILDVLDAMATVQGLDKAKIRAQLRPETKQILDKVD